MALTKAQVQSAIQKATAKPISSEEERDLAKSAVWISSGLWDPETINYTTGNISTQTEELVGSLKSLHKQSESEMAKEEGLLGKTLKMGTSLFRSVVGFSFTSYFDYMIYAMKMFGEYAAEKSRSQLTPQDKKDIIELCDLTEEMVQNYVDHSLYRKISTLMEKAYSDGKGNIKIDHHVNLTKTQTLIATLCRCVNYGTKHIRKPSWLNNIRTLATKK